MMMISGLSYSKQACDTIFANFKNVDIKTCDLDKMEISGKIAGRKVNVKSFIVEKEGVAYEDFDLKLENGFIWPSNSGRYITGIDRKFTVPIKNGYLQVIHSNYIFGDGQKELTNIYYACRHPLLNKCAEVEVTGVVAEKEMVSVLEKIFSVTQ
ncbi:hypothetical protein [Jeongeupia naejangsanensis]